MLAFASYARGNYTEDMSFLSDVGSFINEAQQLGEELQQAGQQFVQQAVTAATDVTDQVSEVTQEFSQHKDAALDTFQATSEDIKKDLDISTEI